MWEQIRPTDIERIKGELVALRAAMLRRHAEDLRGLDSDLNEVETFGRLAAAFTNKFMSSETSPQIAGMAEGQSVEASDPPARPQDTHPAAIQTNHLAPRFETPPRLRRLVGG